MANIPPIPSPDVDPLAGGTKSIDGKLVCPHCQHSFDLTWARYWKSPFGKHQCPECHRKLKLKRESWSYLIPFAASLMGGVSSAISCAFLYPDSIIIGVIIGACALAFPIDKYCDIRFSRMHPIE